MYQITATITKPGGSPVNWMRMSKEKMTREQCEKMLRRAKEVGKSFGDKVTVDNFRCVKSR